MIHPSFISPDQLLDELRKTLPSMAPASMYPVELQKSAAANLLQLCTITMGYRNHRLIASIKVPLISTTAYNIFRVISLPTRVKDHYAYIEPTSEYIAISEDKSGYIFMPSLAGCIESTHKKSFICTKFINKGQLLLVINSTTK